MRPQATMHQRKIATLFSFIRGSVQPLIDRIRMSAVVLQALRDHYRFLLCIPGLMGFYSPSDLLPVSSVAVH